MKAYIIMFIIIVSPFCYSFFKNVRRKKRTALLVKKREPVRYKTLTRGDKILYERNGEELEARVIFNNHHSFGVFAMPIKSRNPEFITYLHIKEKL